MIERYSKTICSLIFTYIPINLLGLQKTNIIRDYLEDINEIPKSRMFWPRQIWSKYVNKLEAWLYKNLYQLSFHIVMLYTNECLFNYFLYPIVHMYNLLLSYSNFDFNIQELKYEENSVEAVQCLNDMITNALIHAEDCLKYMSALRDPAIFRFCAIPQVLFFCFSTSYLSVM